MHSQVCLLVRKYKREISNNNGDKTYIHVVADGKIQDLPILREVTLLIREM